MDCLLPFEELEDPRIDRTKRYPLHSLLLLILSGRLSDYQRKSASHSDAFREQLLRVKTRWSWRAGSGGRGVRYLAVMSRTVLCLLAVMPLFLQAQYLLRTTMELPDLLVGTWEGALGDARYREQWTSAGPSTYEGVAQLLENGQVVSEERMRITRFADQWMFIASTGDVRITSFVRMEVRDGAWIFENREHDYPQRVGYSVHADTLRAYIAHLDDRGQRVDFVLKRLE
jgi:hypothetical protein